MQLRRNPAPLPPPFTSIKTQHDYHHWHMVFNHIRPSTIQQMAKRQLLPNLPKSLALPPPKTTCTSCAAAKLHPARHSRTTHKYLTGEALSSDICGPFPTASTNGNRYFMTVIDTNSRYFIITFMKTRDQATDQLDNVLSHLTTGPYPKPSMINTDNAKEYLSHTTKDMYNTHGVRHSTTVPYSPQGNGIAERVNRTIMNAARAFLHHSGLPEHHWEDAIKDAAFKYSHTLHLGTGQIPSTLWHAHKPNITKYMIFGQLGHVPHITGKTLVRKLHPRALTVRYLIPTDPKHVMVINMGDGKMRRVRSVDFRPYHKEMDPNHNVKVLFKAFTPKPTPTEITATSPAPMHHGQAKNYPDAKPWALAHNSELDNLEKNKVITWIPSQKLPPGTKPIPLSMG